MEELRTAIACCQDQKARKRLNAIHLLLCGGTFEPTLAHSCVCERCLREWICRFNRSGIEGNTYRPRTGRPRNLSPESVREETLPVVDDPPPAGEHHWTAVKLCGWLRENRHPGLSYSTLVRHSTSRITPGPSPGPCPGRRTKNSGPEQREAFAGELVDLLSDPRVKTFFW